MENVQTALWVVVVLVLMAVVFGCTGCGDKNDKDQFKVDTRAMVPVGTALTVYFATR